MKILFSLSLLALGATFTHTSSLAAGPETWTTECLYIVKNSVKTKAPCTVKVYARSTSATEEWEWKNGDRTVVKMSNKGISVNDQVAGERDVSDFIDLEASCFGIKATGEIYCSGK